MGFHLTVVAIGLGAILAGPIEAVPAAMIVVLIGAWAIIRGTYDDV